MVYFLAGTVSEGIKNSFDGDAILLGFLSKKDQVIGEEKMRELGAISRGFHSSPIPRAISEFMRSTKYSMHRMNTVKGHHHGGCPLKGGKGQVFCHL